MIMSYIKYCIIWIVSPEARFLLRGAGLTFGRGLTFQIIQQLLNPLDIKYHY